MAAQGSTQSNVVVAGIASGSNNGCSPIPEEKVIETNVYTYREFIQSVAGDDLGTASCGDLPPVGTPETLVESEWGELTILENEAVREFHVPPDIDLLRVTMNATDWAYQQILFTVNHGAPADAPEANCAHDEWSTWLSCEFVNPQAGTWYAKLRALAEGAEFQVTATMFGNRPNSGKMRVEIDPHTDAVAPGGVLPYTVEIRNVTDQTQTTSALWRVKSPNGNTYPYGPIPLSLAPGQTWTHTGRIDFGEVGPAGPGWMSIETTGPDGSFDRDWTTYRMQKDHAVAVKLSSPDAVVRPGGEWPYTVELQNVLGRRFRASTTWKITDPEGHESVYGPYDIGLAAGQTWKRELTLGYFPQEPLGLWTVTVETTAQGFVDRGSLDVELLPFGVASFERIEGVWDARAITSDGRIVVGNLDFGQNAYLWTEETGVVPIPEGLSAEDVSDDGSVVLGHMTESTTIGPMAFAGRWTETMGWQKLPPLDENYALCGGGWTSGYDMTPDGNVVVGLTWHDGCHAVAFRWTEASGMVAMPLTGSGARANAVSDDGTVVAGFDHHPDYGIRRGAVWTADDPSNPQTSFTESIAPSVWDEDPLNGPGELMSMTPDAKLFGGTSHIALTGAPECPYPGGYLWNRLTGELNNVFGLRGCWATYPLAISADGAIAVGSSGPYTAPVLLGTIWTEDTGLVLLQNFIERLGASIGDVSYLGPATDISNDGKKIVGLTPGEGAWIITLPGAADPAASMRAGLGEVVVSGGVPVHLPVGKKASGAGGEVEVLETNKPVGVVQIEKK
jgi:uncharacterized membrane protein